MRSTRLPSWIERLAGLSPQPAPPHVFVLDAKELAYGLCRREQGRFVLATHEVVQLPPDLFQAGLLGGPARDETALANAIGALLGRLPSVPQRASLVLPDAWLRLAFTESGDLPKEAAARDQVLRWQLKRVVPFRVDELRVRAVEVSPLVEQEQPKRLLLGFGLEELLAQLEAQFAAAGVRIGQVQSVSLALLSALADEPAEDRLIGLALVGEGGYTLLFARGGEPVLHRYKGAEHELPFEAQQRLVERDLKLTRTFLDENLPETPLSRTLVLTDDLVLEEVWGEWLETGLGVPAEALVASHLAPLGLATATSGWRRIAPVLGASRQEVA